MQSLFLRLSFWRHVLLLCLWSVAGSASVAAERLITSPVVNEHDKYAFGLLKLAMSYSGQQYEFDHITEELSQNREFQKLVDGEIDIIWLGTSKYYEEKALPVRIPIYRGLLGYRVFLIRKGEASRFREADTLDKLRQFSYGQGKSWTDTAILKANHFNVVESGSYTTLFQMLEGNRFDIFPRGVHEPWAEMEARPDMAIEVEPSLALAYKMPMYFFLPPSKPKIAEQIRDGLLKAIQDNSFEKYFSEHKLIQDVMFKAHFDKRKVFFLDNPNLPEKTPLSEDRFWVTPEYLTKTSKKQAALNHNRVE